MNKPDQTLIFSILTAGSLFFGISFFAWTLVPHIQMARYESAAENGFANVAIRPGIFRPYTYAQPGIRDAYVRDTISALDRAPGMDASAETLRSATALLEESVERQPNYPKYLYTLARAYTTLAGIDLDAREQNLARAERYYQEAYTLVPDYPEAMQVYAVLLTTKGDYTQAVELLEGVLAYADTPATHFYLGIALSQMGEGRYPDALVHLEQASGKGSQKLVISTYRRLLASFLRGNDRERARIALDRLMDIDTDRIQDYREIEAVLR